MFPFVHIPIIRLGGLWACLLSLTAGAADGETPPLAPGYGPLPYAAPIPGTYSLPRLGKAASGKVIDSSAAKHDLAQLYAGRLVVLSLIYASCDDVNGCPLATSTLHRLALKVQEEPGLRDRVRLLSVSFNPAHDTPEVMARYGGAFKLPGVDWRFATASSEREAQSIMAAYQQSLEPEIDEAGKATGKFSHLLRIYLIDDKGQIRNSYSTSTLHPDLLLADLKTLAAEGATQATEAQKPQQTLGAGADKTGDASAGYRNQGLAIGARRGKPADLMALIRKPPLGLPKVPFPADNPPTSQKIALGRKLFYDRRLSLNQTISCAMCHIPEQGFTSQEQATSVGIEGRTVRRNAPTIYNVGYLENLFHDGRESNLENQVWGPFLAANEMGNPSIGSVTDKIRRLPDYRGLFEAAFRREAGMETVGQAIASYERALVSADSPFDRWYYGKRKDALSDSARKGFELFTGKAGCVQCHTIGHRSALFTDQQMHNTGLGFRESMVKPPVSQAVQLAPGLSVDMEFQSIAQVSQGRSPDLGRYEITQDPSDRWKYKTPSLRNIALTAPYMHNGALASLREVMNFYNGGGEANENLDPRIKPLGLTEEEIGDLVDFLSALTGRNIPMLVSDAFAAPLGDPQ